MRRRRSQGGGRFVAGALSFALSRRARSKAVRRGAGAGTGASAAPKARRARTRRPDPRTRTNAAGAGAAFDAARAPRRRKALAALGISHYWTGRRALSSRLFQGMTVVDSPQRLLAGYTAYQFDGARQASAPFVQPCGNAVGLHAQPSGVPAAASAVLRPHSLGAAVPTFQYRSLGQYPAMRVERADAEADRKVVILIAQLLKLIHAGFPKHAHLYFGALAADESIRLRVRGPGDIEPLASQPAGNQFFADSAFRFRRLRPYPVEGTPLPSVIRRQVIRLQLLRKGRQNLDFGVADRRHVPLHGPQARRTRGGVA